MKRESARIAEIKAGTLYKAEIDESLRKERGSSPDAADDAGPHTRSRTRLGPVRDP